MDLVNRFRNSAAGRLFDFARNSIPYRVKMRKNFFSSVIPLDLNFELTNRCNLRCIYCGRDHTVKTARNIGDMDYDLAKKIIDEFASIAAFQKDKQIKITPVGLGEPLLYSRFFEIVSLIREKIPRAVININTNGILLDNNMNEKIVQSDLDYVTVSVNAWTKENYHLLHKVNQLEAVVTNTTNFLLRRKGTKPQLQIQLLDIELNQPHVKNFLEYWGKYAKKTDALFTRPFVPLSHSDRKLMSEPERKTYNQLLGMEDKKLKKRYPCCSLFHTILINREGFIYPCCRGGWLSNDDELCLGNIKETSIIDLYKKNGKIHDLRKLHMKNKYAEIEACRDCTFWKAMPNIFFNVAGSWI